MAERVHPTDSITDASGNGSTVTSPPLEPISDKPAPPLGTYVIQLPKDQIYRVPPPENARKFAQRTKVKSRRTCCCRCFCWTLFLLLILLVLTAFTAGILYLVFRPKLLKYTVGDNISIRGINLTSSSSPITPRISVNVTARNPNKKLSVYYYGEGSSVAVDYAGISLCNGVFPTFYQPSKNTTVIETELGGSAGIMLGSDVRAAMAAEEKRGNVPLRLNLKAPVKIKVGSVKTWKITVKVKCDIAVDGLTAGAKVVSRKCDYSVKLW